MNSLENFRYENERNLFPNEILVLASQVFKIEQGEESQENERMVDGQIENDPPNLVDEKRTHRILLMTQHRILLYSVKDIVNLVVNACKLETSKLSEPYREQGSLVNITFNRSDLLKHQTVSLRFHKVQSIQPDLSLKSIDFDKDYTIPFEQLAKITALSSWPLSTCKVKRQDHQVVNLYFEQGARVKYKCLQFCALGEATDCMSNMTFIQKKQEELKRTKNESGKDNDGYWYSMWKDFKSQVMCCYPPNDQVRASFQSFQLQTSQMYPQNDKQWLLQNQNLSRFDQAQTEEAMLLTSIQSLAHRSVQYSSNQGTQQKLMLIEDQDADDHGEEQQKLSASKYSFCADQDLLQNNLEKSRQYQTYKSENSQSPRRLKPQISLKSSKKGSAQSSKRYRNTSGNKENMSPNPEELSDQVTLKNQKQSQHFETIGKTEKAREDQFRNMVKTSRTQFQTSRATEKESAKMIFSNKRATNECLISNDVKTLNLRDIRQSKRSSPQTKSNFAESQRTSRTKKNKPVPASTSPPRNSPPRNSPPRNISKQIQYLKSYESQDLQESVSKLMNQKVQRIQGSQISGSINDRSRIKDEDHSPKQKSSIQDQSPKQEVEIEEILDKVESNELKEPKQLQTNQFVDGSAQQTKKSSKFKQPFSLKNSLEFFDKKQQEFDLPEPKMNSEFKEIDKSNFIQQPSQIMNSISTSKYSLVKKSQKANLNNLQSDFNKLSIDSAKLMRQKTNQDQLHKTKKEINNIFDNAIEDMKSNEFKVVTDIKEQLVQFLTYYEDKSHMKALIDQQNRLVQERSSHLQNQMEEETKVPTQKLFVSYQGIDDCKSEKEMRQKCNKILHEMLEKLCEEIDERINEYCMTAMAQIQKSSELCLRQMLDQLQNQIDKWRQQVKPELFRELQLIYGSQEHFDIPSEEDMSLGSQQKPKSVLDDTLFEIQLMKCQLDTTLKSVAASQSNQSVVKKSIRQKWDRSSLKDRQFAYQLADLAENSKEKKDGQDDSLSDDGGEKPTKPLADEDDKNGKAKKIQGTIQNLIQDVKHVSQRKEKVEETKSTISINKVGAHQVMKSIDKINPVHSRVVQIRQDTKETDNQTTQSALLPKDDTPVINEPKNFDNICQQPKKPAAQSKKKKVVMKSNVEQQSNKFKALFQQNIRTKSDDFASPKLTTKSTKPPIPQSKVPQIQNFQKACKGPEKLATKKQPLTDRKPRPQSTLRKLAFDTTPTTQQKKPLKSGGTPTMATTQKKPSMTTRKISSVTTRREQGQVKSKADSTALTIRKDRVVITNRAQSTQSHLRQLQQNQDLKMKITNLVEETQTIMQKSSLAQNQEVKQSESSQQPNIFKHQATVTTTTAVGKPSRQQRKSPQTPLSNTPSPQKESTPSRPSRPSTTTTSPNTFTRQLSQPPFTVPNPKRNQKIHRRLPPDPAPTMADKRAGKPYPKINHQIIN